MKLQSLLSMVLSVSAFFAMAACSSAPKLTPPVQAAPVATPAPTPAPMAKEEKKQASDTLTCTLGSDKREIEVESDDAGCEVHYTKSGKTSTVASDKAGRDHCDKTMQKMKGKLEAAGYKCE